MGIWCHRCNVIIAKGTCCHFSQSLHMQIASCLVHSYELTPSQSVIIRVLVHVMQLKYRIVSTPYFPCMLLCNGEVWPCKTNMMLDGNINDYAVLDSCRCTFNRRWPTCAYLSQYDWQSPIHWLYVVHLYCKWDRPDSDNEYWCVWLHRNSACERLAFT